MNVITVGILTQQLRRAAEGLNTGNELPLDASRLLSRADAYARSLGAAVPSLDQARERLREKLRVVLHGLKGMP